MIRKNKHSNYKKIILAILLLALLVVGVFAYKQFKENRELNKSGVYVVETKNSTEDVAEKEATIPEDDTTNTEDSAPEDDRKYENPKGEGVSSATLKEPRGNFVSIHSVSANTKLESTCVTSPGAKCKIILTRGSVIKELNEMTTDQNGYTAWIWAPSEIGISSGSWTVKAVATANNQTKEATDATPLEITP